MELTLESAFSTGGIVGHIAFMLLVISMLMRRLWLLRVFVIASALVAITYDAVWLKDPVGVFWETMLVLVNVAQLTILYLEGRWAKFSDDERVFAETKLPDLGKAHCRRLLEKGFWVTGEDGTFLTRQGEPVSHLFYLARGKATIFSGDYAVGSCGAGSFIGEMTVLNGEPATGTAVLSDTSHYWMIETAVLRQLVAANPEIHQALSASFTAGLKEKLVHSNEFIAETASQNINR